MGLRGPKQDISMLEETKKLYDSNNYNMAKVAKLLNISREGVRQRLLNYNKYHSDYIKKSTIISVIKNSHAKFEEAIISSSSSIAEYIKYINYPIQECTFKKCLDKDKLKEIKTIQTKNRIKSDFKKLCVDIGHIPCTITDLRKTNAGNSLYVRLNRLFGTYKNFLQELE